MSDIINFSNNPPKEKTLLELFENIQSIQKTNPKVLEAFIKKEIQDRIDSMCEGKSEEYKKSIQQFQWCILKDLRKYKDPIVRMNKMAELFWEGVIKFENGLRNI